MVKGLGEGGGGRGEVGRGDGGGGRWLVALILGMYIVGEKLQFSRPP